ncbi:MAG: hypothetical protein A2283_15100 [Lentisphaerae bacterium RIFOXYA12_FULL_48_11]|nr:MAG: hypothetical protein A2283_15100 [Lentisphaerae bacterium RIFOXYA12_FULL_48_11]
MAATSIAEEIAVIRGTTSTPNDSERNYADAVTKRITRWLTELNIAYRVLDDNAVSADTLTGISTIILGYNPKLPRHEMITLANFAGRGGKFIVFYSSDHELANLLNMKLGNYVSAETGGRWSLMRFLESAPPGLPATIIQESRNIRPAYPANGKSKIMAVWEDASGKSSEAPAWVQSSRGFWMSHILQDDGDTENKKQMLLALTAHCAPGIWPAVNAHHMITSSVLPGYPDFPCTIKGIISHALGTQSESRARVLVDRASAAYLEARQLFDDKQHQKSVEKCRILSSLLAEAYACIQPQAPAKFRGVWEQTGIGLYPGNWSRTCKIVADNGFTDILPNFLMSGIAHYNSRIIPASNSLRLYGDQLAQCLEAAHKNGLRVHVWKGCWRLDYAPDELIRKFSSENRLMISDSGKSNNWLCPSHPDNLRHEKDTIREILQNYPVDGIQLDFIRFKDSRTCFCQGCKKRFETDTGQKVRKWPIPINAEGRREFNRWRCAQITRLVRDVRAITREMRPKCLLSAAVYANYPSVADSIAQDWGNWLKDDLVDFVCPMDYIQNTVQFSNTVQKQLALPSAADRIYPGIGVTASESRLTPIQTMDQITIVSRSGAKGFALFDLDRFLEKEVLPLLHLSATPSP